MKKDYIFMGIAALAVVGGIVGFIVTSNSSSDAKKEEKTQYAAVQPCTEFTAAEAKEVLGETASLGEKTQPKGNQDLKLATCSYGVNDAAVGGVRIASVTFRSGVSDTGATSNKKGFNQNKTENMEAVAGYGDNAYYDTTKAQFNILDGRNWVIVTNGGADPASATLDDAKLVADKVFN